MKVLFLILWILFIFCHEQQESRVLCLVLLCISNYNLQTWRENGKIRKRLISRTNKQKAKVQKRWRANRNLSPQGKAWPPVEPPSPFLAGTQAPQSQRKPQSGFLGWAEAWLSQRNQSYGVFSLSIRKNQIWGGVGQGKRIHTESFKVTCHIWDIKERQKRQTDTWRESWKRVVWTLVLRSHSTL